MCNEHGKMISVYDAVISVYVYITDHCAVLAYLKKEATVIELHSSPTPNGQKVMIMLEETGLEWRHIDVNISLGEQFQARAPEAQPQQ